MRNHLRDLHQPTDSFHDNQTHFYMKGFTQRLVLKQRHKDTFIQELLTRAFDYCMLHVISLNLHSSCCWTNACYTGENSYFVYLDYFQQKENGVGRNQQRMAI